MRVDTRQVSLGASTMMSKDSAPWNARLGQADLPGGKWPNGKLPAGKYHSDKTVGNKTRTAWRKRAAACMLMLMVSSTTGCTLFDNIGQSFKYNSVWNDAAIKMRHRSMSSKSWHKRKHNHCNEGCLDDFCAGYRQGFEDVAGGGTGCTPNFPPRDYWGWQHQSAEGQKKVSAWFAGYPHGARAAEEEGVGNWSQVQMSSNLQAQYVRSGVLPNRGHAVYPITEPSKSPTNLTGKPSPADPVAPTPMGTQVSPVPTAGYPPVQAPVPMSSSLMGPMDPNS